MVHQQKRVQQETAYSAVVVNDHMYPRPCLYNVFHVSRPLLGQKRYRDGDTYDHSLQLLFLVAHVFADVPSLYPPSFHEMIFILVIIKFVGMIIIMQGI